MNIQKVRISDVIRLSALQTLSFKTGILTCTLTVPLTAQGSAYQLLLSGVMRRGTLGYPTMALLNRRLDELYASCIEIRSSRIGKNLSLILTAEMLDDRYVPDGTDVLGGVIDILSEILLHPLTKDDAFLPEHVEKERKCTLDALNAEINNTRSYAVARCTELMYRDDGRYATQETLKRDIAAMDGKSLYRYYRELLATADAEFFYVGSAAPETVAKKLTGAFADYPTHRQCEILPLSPCPPGEAISRVETMPVNQGKLVLGGRTGVCASAENNDYYAVLLFNELLGGSPASKLFLNVREKLSLCYYCSSSYSIYTGDLMISSGVENKNRQAAEDEIRRQLEAICRGEISNAEMAAAKKSLSNCYRQIYDNPLDMQAFLGGRAMFGISDTPEDAIAGINRVSVEEVVKAARRTVLDTVYYMEGSLNGGAEEEEV